MFVAWFESDNMAVPFDFVQPIEKDIRLEALWLDENDTTDSDSDGFVDSLEDAIGTDAIKLDTDGDGLNDCVEFWSDKISEDELEIRTPFEFKTYGSSAGEYSELTAYDETGEVRWYYRTEKYPITEVTYTEDIGGCDTQD